MAWFRIDDKAHSHPKTLAAGNAAYGLWTRLGTWSSDQGTDGFVPKTLAEMYGTRAEIRRLLDVNLLEVDGSDGYRLHDFLDWNPTAAEVEERRSIRAEAGRRGGLASARARSKHEASAEASASPSVGEANEANGNPDPTRPDPTPTTYRYTTTTTCTPVEAKSSSSSNDEFNDAVERIVNGFAASTNGIRNPRRWRQSTRANVIDEHGDTIRAALELGQPPELIAWAITDHGPRPDPPMPTKDWYDQ